MQYVLRVLHLSTFHSLQDQWTPLMTASFEGHDNIVRMLIEASVQVDAQKAVC